MGQVRDECGYILMIQKDTEEEKYITSINQEKTSKTQN